MSEVILIAYADADDLDLFGVLSVLSKVSVVIGPSFFRVASRERTIKLSSGIKVDLGSRWLQLDSATPGRAVIVPGGPGAAVAAQDEALGGVLLAARAAGAHVYACCTGTLILAALGLLEDMQVAMHHLKRPMLAGRGCTIVDGLIRDRWLTSVAGDMASSLKSVDLATQLIRDIAPDALPNILERMELTAGRPLREHTGSAA